VRKCGFAGEISVVLRLRLKTNIGVIGSVVVLVHMRKTSGNSKTFTLARKNLETEAGTEDGAESQVVDRVRFEPCGEVVERLCLEVLFVATTERPLVGARFELVLGVGLLRRIEYPSIPSRP
jgi:hypothetical protein